MLMTLKHLSKILTGLLLVSSIITLVTAVRVDTSTRTAEKKWKSYQANAKPGRIQPLPEISIPEDVSLNPWYSDAEKK